MATNTNYLQALTLVVNQQISLSAIRGVSPTNRIAGNIISAQLPVTVHNATQNSININRITDFQFTTKVQVNQDTQYSGPNFDRQLPLQTSLATFNVTANPTSTANYQTFDNTNVALNYSGLTFTVTNYTTQLFRIPGTYNWTVPAGVTSINVAAIGAGGGGVAAYYGGAGGGGGLSNYENNIPVIPGTSYSITIGTGGTSGNARGVGGGDTYMYPTASGVPIITAGGGAGGNNMFWQYPDRTLTNEDISGTFSTQPAIDPANGTVTYSIASGSLPSNMSLNASSGALTWIESGLATTGTSNTSTVYGPITLSATNGSITVTKPVYLVVNSNPIDPYFTATQLALSMDNTATVFVDDFSIYNNPGVASGYVTSSPFNPFNGSYYSALFDGSTGYLTVSSGIIDIGSQSFSVEFWWYSEVTTRQIFFSSNTDFWLAIDYNSLGAGKLGLFASTNGTSWNLINAAASGAAGVTTGVPNLGQWNHIALSRSVGNWSMWLNGVRILALTGLSNALITRISEAKIIGASTSAATSKVNGWMTGFKFVVGTATYDPTATTITVPTSPITNTTDTKLLMLQEPWIYDKTGSTTVTVNGTVSTTQFHPYSVTGANTSSIVKNSAYFTAATDYVAYENRPMVPLISPDNFTVEAWVYPISRGATMPVIINSYDVTQSGSFALYAGHSTAGLTKWSALIGSGTPNLISNATINFLQWSHVAISKIGNTATFFINGITDSSASISTALSLGGTGPYIVIGNAWDSTSAGSSNLFFTGYISNLRTVNGVGVYTGNFTIPTAPLLITQGSTTNIQSISTNTSTTLLILQNIGPANNSVLLDRSDYNNLITRIGSPAQGSFNPYRQHTSSTFFNGVNATYVGTGTVNSVFALGTGDFTIEAWVLPTVNATNGPGTVFDLRTAAGVSAIVGKFNARRQMVLDGAVTVTFTPELLTMGVWSHVAWSRVDRTFYGYINGRLTGTQAFATDLGSAAQPLYIGYNWTAANGWNGYISNFRIVKGFGVYSGSYFEPEKTPLTTTQMARTGVRPLNTASYTSVLTLQNGYIDNSVNNLLMSVGGAPSSEWQTPFNVTSPYDSYTPSEGGSVYLNGTTDYFLVSNSPPLVLSASTATASFTSTWTIECWVKPIGTYTANNIIYSKRTAAPTGSYEGGLSITTGSVYFSYNAVLYVTPTIFAPRAGVWSHVAWVYNGTTNWLKIYVNGRLIFTAARVPLTEYNTVLRIGANFTPAMFYFGWLSDLRIVKGIAVYETTSVLTSATNTVAFIPPTSKLNTTQPASTNIAAISDSANTSLLLNFNSGAIYDLAAKNNIITVGNAQFSNANYKHGSGSAYFPYTAPTGTGGQTIIDYLRTPLSGSNGTPGSAILGRDFTVEYWFKSAGFKSGNQTTAATYTVRYQIHYDSRVLVGSAVGFFIGTTERGYLVFYTNSTVAITSYLPSQANIWNHVALVRRDGTIILYLNGQPVGSVFNTTVFTDNQSVIGISFGDTLHTMDGYIDGLRITKLARYISSFTPPYRLKGK